MKTWLHRYAHTISYLLMGFLTAAALVGISAYFTVYRTDREDANRTDCLIAAQQTELVREELLGIYEFARDVAALTDASDAILQAVSEQIDTRSRDLEERLAPDLESCADGKHSAPETLPPDRSP